MAIQIGIPLLHFLSVTSWFVGQNRTAATPGGEWSLWTGGRTQVMGSLVGWHEGRTTTPVQRHLSLGRWTRLPTGGQYNWNTRRHTFWHLRFSRIETHSGLVFLIWSRLLSRTTENSGILLLMKLMQQGLNGNGPGMWLEWSITDGAKELTISQIVAYLERIPGNRFTFSFYNSMNIAYSEFSPNSNYFPVTKSLS